MIVMKFGGSSLRDVESVLRVIDIVRNVETKDKIVVLSAVNGVTNHLYKSLNEALESDRRISGLIEYLHMVHKELIIGAIQSSRKRRHALDEIEYLLSRLEKLLYGISYTDECTPRTRDLIVSFGERMAVQLLAGGLSSHGAKACALDSDKIDMVATGTWGYGNADLSAIEQLLPKHLNPLLEQGIIPVITGFFGRTTDNHTISFGRGGTDYSAGIVANAMNAEQLQIWKDVDGFLTASPEIAANPQPLNYLAYDEAAELAYFGAQILHPRTVEPLHVKNIPAVVKNTYDPKAAGTIIGPERHIHGEIIKSVTHNRKIAVLKIIGAGIGYQIGFLREVMIALSDCDINVKSVVTSQTAVCLLLDRDDLEESERRLRELNLPSIESIVPIPDVALIAVVGEGLAEAKGLAARVLTAVAGANANVEMISSGASRVAYYFLVHEEKLEKSVQAIHAEFFEK
jgi:aspartate kinase